MSYYNTSRRIKSNLAEKEVVHTIVHESCHPPRCLQDSSDHVAPKQRRECPRNPDREQKRFGEVSPEGARSSSSSDAQNQDESYSHTGVQDGLV